MRKHKRERQRTSLTMAERITATVALVIAICVMLGTILIVAPAGTPMKQAVQSVATPFFSQKWNVFAPNIMKSNFTLEMRAQWRADDGNLVKSDWVSITDIESRTVTGNVTPSRIQKNSWNALLAYQTRYNSLDSDQKERVRDTFIQRVGDEFEAIPDEEILEELGGSTPAVIRFMRMDYMLMRYTALYATAGFKKDIERVQWRIVSDRPNDFQHRFLEEEQFAPRYTVFGWRQANTRTGASYVEEYEQLIERVGMQDLFQKAAANAQ